MPTRFGRHPPTRSRVILRTDRHTDTDTRGDYKLQYPLRLYTEASREKYILFSSPYTVYNELFACRLCKEDQQESLIFMRKRLDTVPSSFRYFSFRSLYQHSFSCTSMAPLMFHVISHFTCSQRMHASMLRRNSSDDMDAKMSCS